MGADDFEKPAEPTRTKSKVYVNKKEGHCYKFGRKLFNKMYPA